MNAVEARAFATGFRAGLRCMGAAFCRNHDFFHEQMDRLEAADDVALSLNTTSEESGE